MTIEQQKKSEPPKILVTSNALKLAEQWVDQMSKTTEDEPAEVESVARPPRLGLGAKIMRNPQVGPSNDPVQRKLQARLNAAKRNAVKSREQSAKDGVDEEEDEDGELESRSNAFAKKRGGPPVLSLHSTKKRR